MDMGTHALEHCPKAAIYEGGFVLGAHGRGDTNATHHLADGQMPEDVSLERAFDIGFLDRIACGLGCDGMDGVSVGMDDKSAGMHGTSVMGRDGMDNKSFGMHGISVIDCDGMGAGKNIVDCNGIDDMSVCMDGVRVGMCPLGSSTVGAAQQQVDEWCGL